MNDFELFGILVDFYLMDKVKFEIKNIIMIKFKNMKFNIKLFIFIFFLMKIVIVCEF